LNFEVLGVASGDEVPGIRSQCDPG
jgi:hypothetical protein